MPNTARPATTIGTQSGVDCSPVHDGGRCRRPPETPRNNRCPLNSSDAAGVIRVDIRDFHIQHQKYVRRPIKWHHCPVRNGRMAATIARARTPGGMEVVNNQRSAPWQPSGIGGYLPHSELCTGPPYPYIEVIGVVVRLVVVGDVRVFHRTRISGRPEACPRTTTAPRPCRGPTTTWPTHYVYMDVKYDAKAVHQVENYANNDLIDLMQF